MSLDLYLEIPEKCPHCDKPLVGRGTELWWRNITHNVGGMWSKAGVYDALYESHGHYAKEYIEVLEEGLTQMLEKFSEFKKLDAPNGWGLAEHACAFLWSAVQAFRRHPDSVIRVSR